MDADEQTLELQKAIAARLRQAREEARVSRHDLATAIGLSPGSSLYKYETGKRALSVPQIVRAAETLHVSTDWLLLGREPDGSRVMKQSVKVVPSTPRSGLPAATVPVAMPQAILDLLSQGRLGAITNADFATMLEQIAKGVENVADLELAVRMQRLVNEGSEENLRAFLEATERRGLAAGYEPPATKPNNVRPEAERRRRDKR